MACERYAGRLTDAGLEALSAPEDAALIAHLGVCDSCRDAYRRARKVGALMERCVGSLVEGEPSPAFAVRLRARLVEETVPIRWAWGVWIATAAAGAFALAGVLLLGTIHAVRGRHPAPAIVRRTLPPAPPESGSLPTSGRATFIRSVAPRTLHTREAHANVPVVLIDPGQSAAVEEFASAVAADRVNGKELVSEHQKIEKPLEIRTLDIPPLKTEDEVASVTDGHSGF